MKYDFLNLYAALLILKVHSYKHELSNCICKQNRRYKHSCMLLNNATLHIHIYTYMSMYKQTKE